MSRTPSAGRAQAANGAALLATVTATQRQASPLAQLPLGVPHVLVHGTDDDVVPFEQSARYTAAAGGEAELVELDGARHFEPIDPLSPESALVVETVARSLAQ